jgi:hypothetical protein
MKCKTQKVIARGSDLPESLAKISVPQERGRFTQPTPAPKPTMLPLDLAGLRRGLARFFG